MFGLTERTGIMGKASAVINRAPEQVFSFIGDEFFTNYPRWSPQVNDLKKLSEGPVGVGTRARQIRVDQGHRTESTFKITIFDPGKRICFEGISYPYRCDYELAPVADGSGTRVTFTFELTELKLPLRPFEALIRMLIQQGVKDVARKLQRLIETEIPKAREEHGRPAVETHY